MITRPQAVRFWQPAPELAGELLCSSREVTGRPPHLHEEWQFGVAETTSKLSLGAFRRHSASPDDLTVVPPYEVHSEGFGLGEPSRWWMLHVAPSLMARLYSDTTPHIRRSVIGDPAAAVELRELLNQSCAGTTTGSEFLNRVTGWLQAFLSQHAEDARMAQPVAAVERARAYIHSRATEFVSLPEVGAVAGLTTSHLVRSFSKGVGLPPGRYHAQVRLAHARRLLAEGRSATWVAYECGFADQSHLSRRFKECHGVTPGVFQAQYRGQPECLMTAELPAA